MAPRANLVEVGGFFDKVRMIKTPRRSSGWSRGTGDRPGYSKGVRAARPGMTERQVGVMLASELVLNGAEAQSFQVLGAGDNTRITHHRAGDYVLKSGDLMRTDFGGVFPGGYLSDLGRTVVVENHRRSN